MTYQEQLKDPEWFRGVRKKENEDFFDTSSFVNIEKDLQL